MSRKVASTRFTAGSRTLRGARPKLKIEFSPAARRHGPTRAYFLEAEPWAIDEVRRASEEAPPNSAKTGRDTELWFRWVSEALTAEFATLGYAFDAARPGGQRDFQVRLAEALDEDIRSCVGEVKQLGTSDAQAIVRTLKAWSKQSEEAQQLFLTRVLDVTADPVTVRTAHEDVGPRPNVSVWLLLPGSYTHVTAVDPLSDVDLALVYRGTAPAAEELEHLTRAMTPDVLFPSPPIVLQARRNAEARTALLDDFGALTAAQVSEFAGSAAKNTSALAGRWRREGRLLAVEHRGVLYYPGFQFDAEGKPRPVMADVLKHLRRVPAWQQALWFTTVNGWLDGKRPVDLLDTDPDAIVAAAREALREPVG